jgi:hypothetical protein
LETSGVAAIHFIRNATALANMERYWRFLAERKNKPEAMPD